MSLISFRNFMVPLRDKLQLGAILLVPLLILAIRLSEKSLHRDDADLDERPANVQQNDRNRSIPSVDEFFEHRGITNNAPDLAAEATRLREHTKDESGDDLLNKLLADSPMKDEPQAQKTAPSSSKPSSGNNQLKDIRKTLGLE